jgi:hypothetical protein
MQREVCNVFYSDLLLRNLAPGSHDCAIGAGSKLLLKCVMWHHLSPNFRQLKFFYDIDTFVLKTFAYQESFLEPRYSGRQFLTFLGAQNHLRLLERCDGHNGFLLGCMWQLSQVKGLAPLDY